MTRMLLRECRLRVDTYGSQHTTRRERFGVDPTYERPGFSVPLTVNAPTPILSLRVRRLTDVRIQLIDATHSANFSAGE